MNFKQTKFSLSTKGGAKILKARGDTIKSSISEDQLQKQCVEWFNKQYPNALMHHSPNGGKRDGREAAKFKRMGVVPGCPDVLIFSTKMDCHRLIICCGLAIELKVPGGKVSDNQKSFQGHLINNGWRVAICWSFDEFMKEVNGYFGKI